MRLVQVRDNQNRPISNLDVMMGALFGDKVPKEFVPDKYYKEGERVYTFDDEGNLNVWICNMSGRFKKCKEPNFSEWSLNSVIENNSHPVYIPGVAINPHIYECKSAISPRNIYKEYDGKVYFGTKINGFDLSEYNEKHDIVDVYLRREHADSYIGQSEYQVEGDNISIELPFSDMVDENIMDTLYLPFGVEVTDQENTPYWYGEEGVMKTLPKAGINGIELANFDLVTTLGKSIEYGYKLYDIKITSVHTVVGSPLNDRLEKPVFRLDTIPVEEHGEIGTQVPEDFQSIAFDVVIEGDRKVIDTVYVQFSKKTQLITVLAEHGYVQQVQFNVRLRKDKPLSLFMIGSKASSVMSQFVDTFDVMGDVVEHDGEHLVKFPYYDLLKHNSFDFELYVDRIFRSDYVEYLDEDEDCLYIKMDSDYAINWAESTFLFHVFYCISQDAAIVKTSDKQLVTRDKEAFRIPLTTQYINKFQWFKMREDSKLIPPECTVVGKGFANIIDKDHYLATGQTLRADVFSMVFRDNITRRPNSMTDLCTSESYPILEETKELTIPFIDYDAEYDDFLIFKAGGVLFSTSKWYLDDKTVKLYTHENPLHFGDYVDFRLLDRGDTVRVDSRFLTLPTDSFSVDTGFDLEHTAFYLLFTVSGEYISGSKYTVDGSVITFKEITPDCDQPFDVFPGTRLEIVVGVYKKNYSRTLYKMIQIETTDDGQREFDLGDQIEYNPSSDNLMIFRKDGMYVGERFYHTDADAGKIIIDAGSGVPIGSFIDVLVIRNMNVNVIPNPEETEENA